jgi:hypothetical protein
VSRIRVLLLAISVLAASIAVCLFCVYRASQAVPEFYRETLPLDTSQADQLGKQLEQRVLSLHNDLQESQRWQLVVSDQQVNGWIASDLPEKFPGTLPSDIQQPRVVFQEGKVLIACRCKTVVMTTVLSLVLEPYLTEEREQIAIRITRLRAGRVPLPMKRTLERVSAAAAQAGLDLQWTQDQGDPVAVVRLPTDQGESPRSVSLESLRVENGRLSVRGRLADGSRQPF